MERAGHDASGGAPAHDVRVPCPRCGDPIRPGARKCPHCRGYLDRALAEDRRQQRSEQIAYAVEAADLTARVGSNVWAAGIGSFVLCFAGLVFGPVMLGYALYYQHRARMVQMPELPKIRLLFGFAGLWTATGAITAGLWAYYMWMRR